ncbi:MAG TPA: hypothetical protein VFM95_01720 [Microcella sp.]|nr:hypothetical protein [Microcella sp.]
MNLLLIIAGIIAIVLLVTGGLIDAVSFLLYVGIVLLVLALIVFLIRALTGNKRV